MTASGRAGQRKGKSGGELGGRGKQEEQGDTGKTDETGEKDGKRGKVKMEMETGGWGLKREEEMETMCSYVKLTSNSH